MGNDVYCPLLAVTRNRESTECIRQSCGWWDSGGLCCSIKTMAEFQRLGTGRGIAALDQLQSSLDARLGDLLYKLDRLLVEPKGGREAGGVRFPGGE